VEKSPDAFRTISEAADELDLPQHVLRFWETRFSTIKPLKRGGGRRYYRPEDVLLLKGIRHLLYDQGFTIKGVQKILKDQGARAVAAIGSGGTLDALPPPAERSEPDEPPGTAVANGGAPDDPPFRAPPALQDGARDRLNAVLRDLLECKRLLERARE
jgi:DNA-binding transcriptional MerR regulator